MSKSVHDLVSEFVGGESNAVDLLEPHVRAELEAKYPDGFVAVKTICGVACHRPLNEGEYDRYQAMLFDEKMRSKSNKVVAFGTLIHPKTEVFQTWVKTKPGIIGTCANAALELTGFESDPLTKKYGANVGNGSD